MNESERGEFDRLLQEWWPIDSIMSAGLKEMFERYRACAIRGYNAAVEAKRERAAGLEREIEFLRRYGNKDCTAMADEALRRGE